MLNQTKTLKEALRQIGATANKRRSISVNCVRKYIGKNRNGVSEYEYGTAKAHIDALKEEQVETLKEICPYAEIKNFPNDGFAIVSL